jgi:hypothetical protein
MTKLFLVALLMSSAPSFGQGKMIADQDYIGTVHYESARHISSTSELPKMIKLNLEGYIGQSMGAISDSLKFLHGQIVNLKKEFKNDNAVYRRGWIAPKYDLIFLLTDISIGIKKYYVRIELDEYGQIIQTNWPRRNYSERKELSQPQLEKVERTALKIADKMNYHIEGYKTELKYDSNEKSLYWEFYFPREFNARFVEYDLVAIDWYSLDLISEGKVIRIPK